MTSIDSFWMMVILIIQMLFVLVVEFMGSLFMADLVLGISQLLIVVIPIIKETFIGFNKTFS